MCSSCRACLLPACLASLLLTVHLTVPGRGLLPWFSSRRTATSCPAPPSLSATAWWRSSEDTSLLPLRCPCVLLQQGRFHFGKILLLLAPALPACLPAPTLPPADACALLPRPYRSNDWGVHIIENWKHTARA